MVFRWKSGVLLQYSRFLQKCPKWTIRCKKNMIIYYLCWFWWLGPIYRALIHTVHYEQCFGVNLLGETTQQSWNIFEMFKTVKNLVVIWCSTRAMTKHKLSEARSMVEIGLHLALDCPSVLLFIRFLSKILC